jgi:hypothetical protein
MISKKKRRKKKKKKMEKQVFQVLLDGDINLSISNFMFLDAHASLSLSACPSAHMTV